jgi:chromosome segregation ATPase
VRRSLGRKVFLTSKAAITAGARQLERTRRRLLRTRSAIERAQAAERELAAQVTHLEAIAAETHTRGLVAQDPRAAHEARDARSDLERHAALLEDTRQEIRALLDEQDALLDRLLELQTHPGRRNTT